MDNQNNHSNLDIKKDATHPDTAFLRLVYIMKELREKCPWDRKQTIESIRHLTIEETYELADAILDKDMPAISGELGDLLLHIVFYSTIAAETNDFTIVDVANGICNKLIRRHPHIYADVEADTAEKVSENWEQIKMKEGHKSVLSGVPRTLPALVKSYRMQKKTATVGFEWKETADVWAKVQEELAELEEAVVSGEAESIEEEFGDLLFSLVNYSRFIDVNPEDALEKSNRKFQKRFSYIEEQAKRRNTNLKDMSLEEMDVLWNEAKTIG